MSHKYRWKNNNRFKLSFDIYQNDQHIGFIPDAQLSSPAEINGKKFIAVYTKRNLPNEHYTVQDFETTNNLAEIYVEGDRHEVFGIIENKKLNLSLTFNDNNYQSNGLVAQIFYDTMFFPNSGTVEIRSEKNIELLIVAAFFAASLNSIRDGLL